MKKNRFLLDLLLAFVLIFTSFSFNLYPVNASQEEPAAAAAALSSDVPADASAGTGTAASADVPADASAGTGTAASADVLADASEGSETAASAEAENDGLVGVSRGGDANLASGYYTLRSGVDKGEILDISGASTSNFGNVQIYSENYSYAQLFYVENLGNGLYTIANFHSKKVLDVHGAYAYNGQNVWQYTGNGTAAQQWYITDDYGTSAYTVRSAVDPSYVLDVYGGQSNPGTNVQIYNSNGTKAQQWTFEEDSRFSSTGVQEGLYTFENGNDRSKVLDVAGGSGSNGGNVQLYTSNQSNAQKFLVQEAEDGYYSITCLNSYRCLDISGGIAENGRNIQQYTGNGTAAQKWRFHLNSDGSYTLISKFAFMGLDVSGGSTANGANVQLYTLNGSGAQKWFMESVSASSLYSADYVIRSAGDFDFALNVAGSSRNSGANIELGAVNGSDSENFALEKQDSRYYLIRCLVSDCVLDAYDAGTSNGTNIQQYAENDSAAQLFELVSTGDADGSFYIINKNSGLYLDVSGADYSAGTNIHLWRGNGTSAQKFIFVRTEAVHYNAVTSVDSFPSGKMTIKNLLQNGLKPCGRALYIFGGGHGEADNMSWSDVSSSVLSFFNAHATSGYDSSQFNAGIDTSLHTQGFDCSGFVGWTVYNTLNASSGGASIDEVSGAMTSYLTNKGYTYISTNSGFKPGDIAATGYHAWIVLGVCSDGSQVLLQSAITKQDSQPGCNDGVQLSGTPLLDSAGNTISNESQAVALARKYMAKYFPSWPYAVSVQDANYTKPAYITKATFYTDGGTHFTDPEGYRNMSADEVLEDLLGSV